MVTGNKVSMCEVADRQKIVRATHALSRMRLCSASASASAALWFFSEFRSSLRKSGKVAVGLERGRLVRGYRDERVAAGDEPGMVRRSAAIVLFEIRVEVTALVAACRCEVG